MKFKLVVLISFFSCIAAQAQQTPENGRQLFDRAEELRHQSQWKDAIALYSRAITINPGLEDAYLGRASAREQLKDFQGALTDYSIFLELNPDNFDALLARANARYRMGHFEEARHDYLTLLSLPPGETNMVMFQRSASAAGTMQITTAQSDLKPVLLNYLGMCELKLEHFREGLKWLDSAISLRPNESDYYVNRGMIKEKIDGTDPESDYRQALKLNPQNTTALHNLGVLKSSTGQPGEAYFDEAIASDSTVVSPYLERAYQRLQAGLYDQALEDYSRALAIEKNDPEIWLNRGFTREKLGDLEGAFTDYSMAIRLDGEYGKAWLNRGNVLHKLGKYPEAIEDYSTAITFDKDYASAYYNRAVVKARLKLTTEACEDLNKAEDLGMKADPRFRSSVCR